MGVPEWHASVCPHHSILTPTENVSLVLAVYHQPAWDRGWLSSLAWVSSWLMHLRQRLQALYAYSHVTSLLLLVTCYQSQETQRAGHISQKILKIMDTMIWLSKSVKQSEYRLHNISYLVCHEMFIFFCLLLPEGEIYLRCVCPCIPWISHCRRPNSYSHDSWVTSELKIGSPEIRINLDWS